MYSRFGMRLMSIKQLGLARRNFIIGMRLWPPLRIFASSPRSDSNETASERLPGLRYSNDAGTMNDLQFWPRGCLDYIDLFATGDGCPLAGDVSAHSLHKSGSVRGNATPD